MTELRTISPGFRVDTDYQEQLAQVGIDSLPAVFAFQQGQSLTKANLDAWRHRIRFQLPNGQYAYLKRYAVPPKRIQIKAWLQHGQHRFLSEFDQGPTNILRQAGVSIPTVIAVGGQWKGLFEQQSFIITLELHHSCSLEKKLPDCFYGKTAHASKRKKEYIAQLADFVRRFHATGYRHRDLYLAHIFLSEEDALSLIDLHRCFAPGFSAQRYRIKDLAQLHYSCRGDVISYTDRLRFYKGYQQINTLTASDKACIRKIHTKALRIACHDRKHGRTVPFEKKSQKGRPS